MDGQYRGQDRGNGKQRLDSEAEREAENRAIVDHLHWISFKAKARRKHKWNTLTPLPTLVPLSSLLPLVSWIISSLWLCSFSRLPQHWPSSFLASYFNRRHWYAQTEFSFGKSEKVRETMSAGDQRASCMPQPVLGIEIDWDFEWNCNRDPDEKAWFTNNKYINGEKKETQRRQRRYQMLKNLLGFLSEWASFSQTSSATSWLAQNSTTSSAEDDSGSMREYSSNLETTRALHIHEERIGRLNKTLQLMELGLILGRGMK